MRTITPQEVHNSVKLKPNTWRIRPSTIIILP